MTEIRLKNVIIVFQNNGKIKSLKNYKHKNCKDKENTSFVIVASLFCKLSGVSTVSSYLKSITDKNASSIWTRVNILEKNDTMTEFNDCIENIQINDVNMKKIVQNFKKNSYLAFALDRFTALERTGYHQGEKMSNLAELDSNSSNVKVKVSNRVHKSRSIWERSKEVSKLYKSNLLTKQEAYGNLNSITCKRSEKCNLKISNTLVARKYGNN